MAVVREQAQKRVRLCLWVRGSRGGGGCIEGWDGMGWESTAALTLKALILPA